MLHVDLENLGLRLFYLWIALYYVTFYFGDPRRLNSGEGLFDVLAMLIVVLCMAILFFPQHIGLSSLIGAMALAHSLGACLTALLLADEISSTFASQIARLAWVGPTVLLGVIKNNKFIVSKDIDRCLRKTT